VTGYDDEKSDYNTYVGEQINYRYEILDILGKGSFGQALKCIDHKTQQIVAVKIIRSKKKFYHQATIEAKILKYIRDNDLENKANIIKILDSFMFRKHIVSSFIMFSVLLLN
jgi:dual specificity tyrosine-phosphorylation-regulated kinase 2/3/4